MCERVSTLLRLQTSLPPLHYGPLGVAGPASSLIVNLSLQGHYSMVKCFYIFAILFDENSRLVPLELRDFFDVHDVLKARP